MLAGEGSRMPVEHAPLLSGYVAVRARRGSEHQVTATLDDRRITARTDRRVWCLEVSFPSPFDQRKRETREQREANEKRAEDSPPPREVFVATLHG